MTIEAEFADLMLDEVTVAPAGTRDAYGAPAYGTAVAHRCRLVRENRTVRTDAGDEVVSRSHAYVYGAPGIAPTDRVTLPDGTTPVILAVERFPDENGAHHEVVYFGAAGRGA